MKNDTDKVSIAVMANQVSNIQSDVRDIKGRLEKDYVTQDQFDPIKRLVYGVVGLVLASVVLAVLALIITRK